MKVTDEVAKFVVRTRYEDIPRKAFAVAKQGIMDCIGVALAGAKQQSGMIAGNMAKYLAPDDKSATILGQGIKSTVELAALVNGTSAHALDYDDVIWSLTGHPSASLVPAVLALGEVTNASGQKILEAYTIGIEVMAKIGLTAMPAHSLERGWHATSTIGTIGTTAACAKLLNLDTAKTKMALGIATSMASGAVGNFGTMTKPLHAGLAAKNGVIASLLANGGFTARENALEGPKGFYEIYCYGLDCNFSPIQTLGNPFDLMVKGIVIKPYPCGVANHPGIDGALILKNKYNFKPEDIERIDVGATRYTNDKLAYKIPRTGLEGKFSMPYNVSRAIHDGTLTLNSFTDEAVKDPVIISTAEKVNMFISEEIEKNWKGGTSRPCSVEIHLKDGRKLYEKVEISKGNPENPLTMDELKSKFRDCASLSISKKNIENSLDMIQNIESIDNIKKLCDILKG